MRAVLISVLSVFLSCSGAVEQTGGTVPSSARAPTRLTVVTFNMHAGKDAGGQPNLDRIAAVLDSIGADVAFLQEVDRGTRRSGGVDQVAELERLTGMHGVFGKSLDYDGGDYGIAVLSRLPIERTEVVPLTVTPPEERSGGSYEPRVALFVRVQTDAGPLPLLNTHLGTGSPVYRRQEMVDLLAAVHRLTGRSGPVIVGGDMNARPDTPEIGAASLALEDAFASCGNGPGESFPADAPDRRIDYLLLRGVACGSARVADTRASDHRPLVLTISVRPGR